MTTVNQTQQNLVYLTGRLSFPWIADPQSKVNDKGETISTYNTDIIMAPTDAGFAKFMQVYQALAVEKWKENTQAAMQRIQADRKTRCYGAGEEKVNSKTFQVHAGYAGNVFISARSQRQPQIIGLDGKQIDPSNTMQIRAETSRMTGGNWVNVVVKPWLQQNTQGIGVRCDLVAIQFAREDEQFGAGAVDTSGFFGAVQGAAPAAPMFAPAAAMPAAPFPGAVATPAPTFGVPGTPSFM